MRAKLSEIHKHVVKCKEPNIHDTKAQTAKLIRKIVQGGGTSAPFDSSLVSTIIYCEACFKILENRSSSLCRCNIYPETNQLNPKSEIKYGLIEILEVIKDEDWEYEFLCKCPECKQRFNVLENHGYHYPWSKWEILP